MAWIIGQKSDRRDGETWREAIEPWDRLQYANADAGTGLRKGLSLIQQQREQTPNAPKLEIGLDVFHIKKEASTVLARRWNKVEHLWNEAEKADRVLAEHKRSGQYALSPAQKARHAWQRAEEIFQEYERVESAWRRAEKALNVFCDDRTLNDRRRAEELIREGVEGLPGEAWAKTCRMLQDPRALTFLDRLHRQLEQAEPNEELREALVRLWWMRHHDAPKGSDHRSRLPPAAKVVQRVVCQKIDPNWQLSYQRVGHALSHVVRASSLVECMNSVIRMQQARHRRVTQDLLDLKRLWWNCRRFTTGKRRKRSPYEHLGVQLPTTHFWSLLKADPGELTQEVST
jgi:hypothetical protein